MFRSRGGFERRLTARRSVSLARIDINASRQVVDVSQLVIQSFQVAGILFDEEEPDFRFLEKLVAVGVTEKCIECNQWRSDFARGMPSAPGMGVHVQHPASPCTELREPATQVPLDQVVLDSLELAVCLPVLGTCI